MDRRGYRVYYLDPEEDINSLIAELGQTTLQKIALVVHQSSNIFNSRINIQLLQKYLKDWQKELVFISAEMRLIRLSLEIGIKIYADLEAFELDEPIEDVNEPLVTSLSTEELLPDIYAQTIHKDESVEEIPMYRSRRHRKHLGRKITVVVVALVILLGMGWFYFNFSIVTVEISPIIEDLEQNFQLTCDHDLQKIQLAERKIPMVNAKYEVKGQATVPTTGQKRIGYKRAEGKVVFFNNQKKNVTVPAGTVLKTSKEIKFKTVQTVTVPALTENFILGVSSGTTSGMAEVNMVALEAGSQGNVSVEKVSFFDGKDYGLEVRNPKETHNGSDRTVMTVAQADLEKVMENLEIELKNKIINQLSDEVNLEYQILKDTLQCKLQNISVNHSVDMESEVVTATAQMVATSYLLRKEDLRIIIADLYRAELPDYYRIRSGNIELSELSTFLQADGKAKVNLKATAQVIADVQPKQIIEKLKGQTVAYANSLLEKMNEIKNHEIFADGKSKIPNFTFAIRVIVRAPTDAEEGSI
ncbi:MAG: baseplate J/gp47 family protein [Halanaerobiales bacterium]|nr:baseplate J/gp47 family protein [Halanaerobiales bacterium]